MICYIFGMIIVSQACITSIVLPSGSLSITWVSESLMGFNDSTCRFHLGQDGCSIKIRGKPIDVDSVPLGRLKFRLDGSPAERQPRRCGTTEFHRLRSVWAPRQRGCRKTLPFQLYAWSQASFRWVAPKIQALWSPSKLTQQVPLRFADPFDSKIYLIL